MQARLARLQLPARCRGPRGLERRPDDASVGAAPRKNLFMRRQRIDAGSKCPRCCRHSCGRVLMWGTHCRAASSGGGGGAQEGDDNDAGGSASAAPAARGAQGDGNDSDMEGGALGAAPMSLFGSVPRKGGAAAQKSKTKASRSGAKGR